MKITEIELITTTVELINEKIKSGMRSEKIAAETELSLRTIHKAMAGNASIKTCIAILEAFGKKVSFVVE